MPAFLLAILAQVIQSLVLHALQTISFTKVHAQLLALRDGLQYIQNADNAQAHAMNAKDLKLLALLA
jgi:hypothetical protein